MLTLQYYRNIVLSGESDTVHSVRSLNPIKGSHHFLK